MQKVDGKEFHKKISKNFVYGFAISDSGLYLIEITASAKSWWQNFINLHSFFKDDDLAVKIDGREFPKLDGRRGLFDGEAAWNGNNLKGLSKTNAFFINLDRGEHTLYFLADQKPVLENIAIFKIEKRGEISYLPASKNPSQEGNRRQWVTFAFVDLTLKNFKITAQAQQGKAFSLFKRDDSDLKLVIDGEIQKNEEPKSHKYWFWCGRTLKGNSKTFSRNLNLSESPFHYIELWADRTPKIEDIRLGIEEISRFPGGRVAIYEDIVENVRVINLRSRPDENSEIITEISNGGKVFIQEQGIQGSRPVGLLSDIWHKISYDKKEGFAHSSFIEIDGQEREAVIWLIKSKAKELQVDKNLALNLAHCESKWLPFAHSGTNNRGIYQLGESTIEEINKKHGGNIGDPYNAEQNIDGGLKYFRYLLDKYKGSQDYLRKAVSAWSRGPERVPFGGPFVFEKQSEGTQILLNCVLEEKRGEKHLKILGLVLLISLMGFSTTFLGGNRDVYTKYPQKERSVYLSDKHTASLIDEARKDEVRLTKLEDDFDGDGVFETIEFGFISPEAFHYTTIVHPPNGDPIDIYGSFSEAKTRDLNNDGVKELILQVKSGKEFSFFLFSYEKGALRLLPTFNNLPDPYEGIWGVSPLEFSDIDNDGFTEIISQVATYMSGGWRDWHHIVEYYQWNGDGFELYNIENDYFAAEPPRG